MQQKYIDILIKLAIKASKKDEVPISAIIVKNNKILVKAYNNRNKKNSILGHAEIIAINKATKKLKDWRLFDCDLYVTLKPCSICENIIKQSRIRNKPETKKEYNKTIFNKLNNTKNEQKYVKVLNNFFKKKRDNKRGI